MSGIDIGMEETEMDMTSDTVLASGKGYNTILPRLR